MAKPHQYGHEIIAFGNELTVASVLRPRNDSVEDNFQVIDCRFAVIANAVKQSIRLLRSSLPRNDSVKVDYKVFDCRFAVIANAVKQSSDKTSPIRRMNCLGRPSLAMTALRLIIKYLTAASRVIANAVKQSIRLLRSSLPRNDGVKVDFSSSCHYERSEVIQIEEVRSQKAASRQLNN